ncbi:MAG TPA: hypothetical protein PLK80_10375 [bacterium]|nr:MAG: hypothetical protein BWY28_01155 [bacterium ADurb.Bin236]HOY61684.1 hypothetical protein [bacterium]HPI77131.1 hypothetical protein [bacterium]HPN93267.1 hypothetical protein [bacterium]
MKMKKVFLSIVAGLMISPLAAFAAADDQTADISFNIQNMIVLNIDSGDVAVPTLADVSFADLTTGEVEWITTGVLSVDATEDWKLEVASTSVADYFGGTGNATKALSDLAISVDSGSNYVNLSAVDATSPVELIASGVGLGVPGVGITLDAIQYKLALDATLDVAGTYTANLTFTAITN